MRVERASVDSVKQRLAELKRKVSTNPAPRISAIEEYKAKLDLQDAEKEDFKRRRKEESESKRLQAKAVKQTLAEEEESNEMDPDMALMMGFNGFSTSKR
jgi:U4/U6.U5 tri-snRNP component SNU23